MRVALLAILFVAGVEAAVEEDGRRGAAVAGGDGGSGWPLRVTVNIEAVDLQGGARPFLT